MNDEAFSRLVAEEVKNKASEAQRKYLALPENLERWKRALQYLSSNLEEQIVEIDRRRKSASASMKDWVQRAIFFLQRLLLILLFGDQKLIGLDSL